MDGDLTSEEILEYMADKYGKHYPPLGMFVLDYFREQGLMHVVEHGRGIEGVMIFRKVKLRGFNPRDRMSHDKKGDCAFVVELCADNKKAIAECTRAMEKRLGNVKSLGMHRRGTVHFYDYDRYVNKLLGNERIRK